MQFSYGKWCTHRKMTSHDESWLNYAAVTSVQSVGRGLNSCDDLVNRLRT